MKRLHFLNQKHALSALKQLIQHILLGCLSDIPPGGGMRNYINMLATISIEVKLEFF